MGRPWRRPVPGGRPVAPIVATAVPRSIAVVIVPVGCNRKGDDRYADARAVGVDVDAPIVVGVLQIFARDPAAIGAGDDVAPVVIVDAALYRNGAAGRQHRDARKLRVRTGAQRQVDGHECIGSPGEGRNQEQQRREQERWPAFHGVLPRLGPISTRTRGKDQSANAAPGSRCWWPFASAGLTWACAFM